MDAEKISKALLDECKDCGERFRCDKGEQFIYCPNREAADYITAAHARIAELEAKLKAKEMDYSALQESYINAEMNLEHLQSHDKEAMELLELVKTICDRTDDIMILKQILVFMC